MNSQMKGKSNKTMEADAPGSDSKERKEKGAVKQQVIAPGVPDARADWTIRKDPIKSRWLRNLQVPTTLLALSLTAQSTAQQNASPNRFNQLKAQAEKGVVEAQRSVAISYYGGDGVAKDL